eukprot:1849144-Rhodomonas_salina.3
MIFVFVYPVGLPALMVAMLYLHQVAPTPNTRPKPNTRGSHRTYTRSWLGTTMWGPVRGLQAVAR